MTFKEELSRVNWLEPARRLVQIIARRVVDGRRRSFFAKLGIVEEEADESAFWLELIIEGDLLKENLVTPLLDEANELTRIMASSRISASRKVRANRQLAIGNRQ